MKIGIFGGTFNPPHNGHVETALKFKEHLRLDIVLFVPTLVPPHKEHSDIDAMTRLKMTELAVKDIDGFFASDIDIRRGGVSYSVLTIKDVRNLYKDAKLYFLCGSDMFVTLDNWYNAKELFRSCTVAGAARNAGEYCRLLSYAEYLRQKYKADAKVIRIKPYPISSSEIREMIYNGEDASHHINALVYNYIKENGLYVKK